jgi:hypothetical protein
MRASPRAASDYPAAMNSTEATLCPVCGFDLGFQPWNGRKASEAVCGCCGIRFGLDDQDPDARTGSYLAWRQQWVQEGMRWWGPKAPSSGWDPVRQLRRVSR